MSSGGKKMKPKGKKQTDANATLQIPDIKPSDPASEYKVYTSIVKRKHNSGTILKGYFPTLKKEVDTMRASVTKRREVIENELKTLSSETDEKDTPTSSKPSTSTDSKQNKKFKDNYGKAHSVTRIGRPRHKNVQVSRLQDGEFADHSTESPKVSKDSPNRFWAYIDPYCAEITQDDIKFLEEWIKESDYGEEFDEIPSLGKHYSLTWAKEDLDEEKIEGSKCFENKKGLDPQLVEKSDESNKLFQQAMRESESEEDSQMGSLTKHLISCLAEQNIMTPDDEAMIDNQDDFKTAPVRKRFTKSQNSANPLTLEQKIRNQLVQHGFLDPEDLNNEDEDDEVLTEINRLQASLVPVCEYNLEMKNKLLKIAKEELVIQEIRKKLKAAEAEVLETLRKYDQAKKENKKFAKKEQEQTMKLIKEREILKKQLDDALSKKSDLIE